MCHSRKLPAVVLVLAGLLWLAGCNREPGLAAADLMPAGAVETAPPQIFVDSVLKFGGGSGDAWIKGFTAADAWEDVVNQVDAQAAAHNYHPVVPPHFPEIDAAQLSYDRLMRYYQSSGKTRLVGVINVKYLRESGGKVDGTADYAVFSGPDASDYEPRERVKEPF
jgi:hypothetical protein